MSNLAATDYRNADPAAAADALAGTEAWQEVTLRLLQDPEYRASQREAVETRLSKVEWLKLLALESLVLQTFVDKQPTKAPHGGLVWLVQACGEGYDKGQLQISVDATGLHRSSIEPETQNASERVLASHVGIDVNMKYDAGPPVESRLWYETSNLPQSGLQSQDDHSTSKSSSTGPNAQVADSQTLPVRSRVHTELPIR